MSRPCPIEMLRRGYSDARIAERTTLTLAEAAALRAMTFSINKADEIRTLYLGGIPRRDLSKIVGVSKTDVRNALRFREPFVLKTMTPRSGALEQGVGTSKRET